MVECTHMLKKANAQFLISFLIEALPFIVFLATFAIYHNFFFSVLALLIVSFFSITSLWIWKRRISYIDLYVIAITLIFDGRGFVIHSPGTVMFRDTFYDGLLGLMCIGSLFITNRKPLLEYMFEAYCDLTARGWWLATFRTGILFVFLALGNEIARSSHNLNYWVLYKTSTYFIVILFVVIFLPQMRRYSPHHAKTYSFIIE